MRIIISDTSALIDLRKAALLKALLRLPYEVHVPDLLYEDELISIPDAEKRALRKKGLRVTSLPGDLIDRAVALERIHPALRLNDCSAWALAERMAGCVLLTGDNRLRTAAGTTIEVHGVLWAFDQVQEHRAASIPVLRAALTTWIDDDTVWLPAAELKARLRRLE